MLHSTSTGASGGAGTGAAATSSSSSSTTNGKVLMNGSATGSATGNGHTNSTSSVNATIAAAVASGLDANTKRVEREHLRAIIAQWNANRLDLFEISEPNEELEFYGVMRFYFQDAGQKVATKCLRISSSASTHDVIANLIEKFRPDIRMLSVPEYALYEIHENGEERKLAEGEMPLLVQLNWHKDDREGRFLLRRMDEKTNLSGIHSNLNTHSISESGGNLLHRKLSKREKKEKKKREKKEKAAAKSGSPRGKDSLAEKLYTELPETSFTRSISNPEAVMRRRRQQKLEKKLQQFSAEGGPEAGGTLRIFGEALNADVPYKTILLSSRDTAAFAVKEILEKYGLEGPDPSAYCLVQIVVPYGSGAPAAGPNPDTTGNTSNSFVVQSSEGAGSLANAPVREYILDDDDCPLIIERSHLKTRGVLTFHIRRRPPDYQPRKRKKKSPSAGGQSYDGSAAAISAAEMQAFDEQQQLLSTASTSGATSLKLMPYLVEVNADGSDLTLGASGGKQGAHSIAGTTGPRRHFLYTNVTEVGGASEALLAGNRTPSGTSNSIQLLGPNIKPRHCIITHSEGLTTVTPVSPEAETTVNGSRITETTILKHGMLLRFGKLHTFKFVDEHGEQLRRVAAQTPGHLSTGAIIGQHFAAQAALNGAANTSSVDDPTTPGYETTFDAEGRVSMTENRQPVSGQFNNGSLQRQHPHSQQHYPNPTGSLPRSASANSGHHQQGHQHQHQNSADTAQQLMPPPSGTPNSMSQQMRGPPTPSTSSLATSGPRKPGTGDNILPAILEVWEEIEPHFLNLIINRVDPNAVQFKLAITYTLYMVTRFRASTYFKPEIVPNQRATLLIGFCIRYATAIQSAIGEHLRDQAHLAFWLANSSELLHFLKNDRHLSAFTLDSQEILADAIQFAFTGLVRAQQAGLREALSSFPDDGGNSGTGSTSTSTTQVLGVLSASMQLLRRFRVNAALTIQLFSQLFHYINMALFNRVLGSPQENLCSRSYGARLQAALLEIEAWAEKQGLELAAECHLSRLAQTATFLVAPKCRPPSELASLAASLYKLNSLQLQALCERYQPTPEEVATATSGPGSVPYTPLTDKRILEPVVSMARVATDELLLKEGREVKLEEEVDLQLPFLLPEDGYSCDIVIGIPATLADFVQSLVAARVARLTVQPTASGYWTIYFINFTPEQVHQQNQQNQQQYPSGGEEPTSGQLAEPSSGSSVTSKSSTLVAADSNSNSAFTNNNRSQSMMMMNASGNSQTMSLPGQGMINGASGSQFSLGKGAGFQAQQMSPLPSPQRSLPFPGMSGPFGSMNLNMPPPAGGAPFNHFNGMRAMPEPEVQTIKLQKINNGIGLSIVAAQGTHQPVQGIYIKSVVRDGAADLDGRLKAGDQLLKVDGHSLIGIDQESAAKLMTNTGPVVTLEVAKQGAVFHGLSGLLKEGAQLGSAGSTSSLLLKQATMRPRFAVPNGSGANFPPSQDHYGAIRSMNNSNNNLMHPRMGMNPNAYNTLPVGAMYNQQQQQMMAAAAQSRLSAHNSASHGSLALLQAQAQQAPMRSESQLSFNSASKMPIYEERHYQNINLYQLNPRTGSPIGGGPGPGGPGGPRTLQYGSHTSLQPEGNLNPLASSSASLLHHNRPVSALVTSREQELVSSSLSGQQTQQYGQLTSGNKAGQSQDARQRDLMRQEAKMEEIREELRRREDRGGAGGPNVGQAYLGGPSAAIPRQLLGTLKEGRGQLLNGTGGPPMSMMGGMMTPGGASTGTLLRTGQQAPSAANSTSGGRQGSSGGPPPAPAPKPSRPTSSTANLGHSTNSSTLQQPSSLPMTQVSYRYGPSGYPAASTAQPAATSKSTTLPAPSGGQRTTSPSPWEREEKEKELATKHEDSRDEEIRNLQSLPYRSPKNEDRLRALILERDFQRRAKEEAAEEAAAEDEGTNVEENEARLLERADARERMLNLQADIERTRQRRLAGRYGGKGPEAEGPLNRTLEEQEERLKVLRLEEEAAQQAEERLLKEAAKRRQETDETSTGRQANAPPLISKGILKVGGYNNSNNFDNDLPPPLPNSPPPLESANKRLDRLLLATVPKKEDGNSGGTSAPRGGVLKNGTAYNGSGEATGPSNPAKKVSWNTKTTVVVTPEDAEDDDEEEGDELLQNERQAQGGQMVKNTRNNDQYDDNEEGEEMMGDEDEYYGGDKGTSAADLEETFSLQDIEDALVIGGDGSNAQNGGNGGTSTGNDSSADLTATNYEEEWNTKYVSSGHTSGVIGTQEIYNDPRQRIEAARQRTNASQAALAGDKVPEKLSFAEKMKMFAKTSGAAAEDENNQIPPRGGGAVGGNVPPTSKSGNGSNKNVTSTTASRSTLNGDVQR